MTEEAFRIFQSENNRDYERKNRNEVLQPCILAVDGFARQEDAEAGDSARDGARSHRGFPQGLAGWGSSPARACPTPQPGAGQTGGSRGQPQPWALGTSLGMGIGQGRARMGTRGVGVGPSERTQGLAQPHDGRTGPRGWGQGRAKAGLGLRVGLAQ